MTLTLTLTLTLALALTNLTRWTSRRLEHQCGRPGPALGPGLTSPWAGPAAAARLWLSYQGNCGVSRQTSSRRERGSVGVCATVPLCGRRGVSASALVLPRNCTSISIYSITYQYDVFAVPSILCTTRYVYISSCAFPCVSIRYGSTQRQVDTCDGQGHGSRRPHSSSTHTARRANASAESVRSE